MEKRIGRDHECEELSRAMESSRSEFVVLYGRRRIGKTFLVRSFFKDHFDFHYVGAHKAKTAVQLQNFRKALIRYGGETDVPAFSNWMEAFGYLASWIERLDSAKRKVLFFDEMPWIDAKQSDFVAALEYFWNSWVAMRDDILLIACGSATSWMADKLIDNPGGLHNRITRRIYLRPFTLHECQEYLESRGFDWDRYQIIQCYMILGGVPFYWSLLESQFSLPQNIDRLCFRRDGMLCMEFDELYSALFSNAERYISVVRALSNHREGMTRDEIMKDTRLTGGNLTKVLKNLERCDFTASYTQFGGKSKNTIHRLSDFYTLFYFKFLHDARHYDEDYWSHHFLTQSVAAWEGLTFELVCLTHLPQIKKALGISGMETHVSAWRYMPGKVSTRELPTKGAQIDLIISRADKIIHLCEIKFSDGKFVITKEYEQHLRERLDIFRQVTQNTAGLVHTFITPQGVASGSHRSIVNSEITANDLFAE
ncbi:MAG: ATP-binding protein [Victivallales bacterium]|nr:ATP-binding protein [Victivallales bacterium]